MATMPGPGVPANPHLIPAHSANVAETSHRIAREAIPTLHEAKGFRSFGVLAGALALGKAAVIPGTIIKDFGSFGALYDAARANERIAGQTRALTSAAAHARIAGQIGFDLARARIAISQTEEIARVFKSRAAESALVFMRPELQKLQLAFESERLHQSQYRKIAVELGLEIEGATSSRLGEFALAAEKVASRSPLGRSILATGKFLANPTVAKSMVALGIGIASIKGYVDAETHSKAWKVGYGVGAGLASGVADAGLAASVATRGGSPASLLFDPAVKYGATALGHGELGDRLTIGTFYEDCSKSIVALTQAVTTGDMEPMNAAHSRLMQGKGSAVLQGYASIGESLSRSRLIDTGLTKLADWHSNVPTEFKTSPSWWEAVRSDVGSISDIVKGVSIAAGEKLGIIK
jgi:hypothetical protein